MLKQIKSSFKRSKTIRSLNNAFKTLQSLEQQTNPRFKLHPSNKQLCFDDNTTYTGFDRHYVYHPAWAARIVKQINPQKHIDISSTLHFCSILSAFIPVDFYDYRPAQIQLDHLKSLQADLMNLPFETDSVTSISCMHTIEHIGLGRYGDPLDYDGDIKAIKELKRVVAPGGNLLIVVPLGAENIICFNAHRIYNKHQILELFKDMKLIEFTLIPENEKDGGLINNPDDNILKTQFYGCSCFWFQK